MTGLSLIHLPALLALRIINCYASLRSLDIDNAGDNADSYQSND